MAELMKSPTAVSAAAAPRPAVFGEDAGAVIDATGAIITAYVKGAPDLSQEELLELIRTVRQALSS
jgi:predicted transcriptional regulator